MRLLQRARALGDYLIVGVTSEDFDKARGKINVRQSLIERIEGVRSSGLADKIIVEEYEGQKIDDIRRYDVDIFTVGSDWRGKFDYLKEYCQVVYLDRTENISSSMIRSTDYNLTLGLAGDNNLPIKYLNELHYVNGMNCSGFYTKYRDVPDELNNVYKTSDYCELLKRSNAVYIATNPDDHYKFIKCALEKGKHVICESPVCLSVEQIRELYKIADENHVVLMDAIKTAYSIAYNRLLLILKSGRIGNIVSVDVTCTSLRSGQWDEDHSRSSLLGWGPTALLPVFQILGTDWLNYDANVWLDDQEKFDWFTRIIFTYKNAVASIRIGTGVKSEGELVISGTKGYIYVPAPWWKTEYFEIRYEDQTKNQKVYYQLEGEGIRYELLEFLKNTREGKGDFYISRKISMKIVELIDECISGHYSEIHVN